MEILPHPVRPSFPDDPGPRLNQQTAVAVAGQSRTLSPLPGVLLRSIVFIHHAQNCGLMFLRSTETDDDGRDNFTVLQFSFPMPDWKLRFLVLLFCLAAQYGIKFGATLAIDAAPPLSRHESCYYWPAACRRGKGGSGNNLVIVAPSP